MRKPIVILASVLSSVALAGAVGVGVAAADPTPSPSASPSPSAAATSSPGSSPTATPGTRKKAGKAGAGAKRDLTRRALHGEVTLGGKKHLVVDVQRGTVSAVSASSISVLSSDGFSATYVVDAKTRVRHTKLEAAIADVQIGDEVRVAALKGSTLTARQIADRTK